jgi:hypothetical protein
MAGLGPAIHAFLPNRQTWMPATIAGMTIFHAYIRSTDKQFDRGPSHGWIEYGLIK